MSYICNIRGDELTVFVTFDDQLWIYETPSPSSLVGSCLLVKITYTYQFTAEKAWIIAHRGGGGVKWRDKCVAQI